MVVAAPETAGRHVPKPENGPPGRGIGPATWAWALHYTRSDGGLSAMTCHCVEFAQSNCLIEIETQAGETGQVRFVARMSVIEENGAIVRPLFGNDGRRIKILATSERLTLRVALSYLEGRFGRMAPREQVCRFGASTVGVPYVTH